MITKIEEITNELMEDEINKIISYIEGHLINFDTIIDFTIHSALIKKELYNLLEVAETRNITQEITLLAIKWKNILFHSVHNQVNYIVPELFKHTPIGFVIEEVLKSRLMSAKEIAEKYGTYINWVTRRADEMEGQLTTAGYIFHEGKVTEYMENKLNKERIKKER